MIGLFAPIRPLTPEDAERLQRMFHRLSADTVMRRFFTLMPELNGTLLSALVDVDHDRHEALVVAIGDEIVALASYHRRRDDPTVAEVAVLIEDAWQHTGLGRRLMRQLTRMARDRGITTLHAEVLPDNKAAIGLIKRMTPAASGRYGGGAVSYDLTVVPAA